MEIKDLLIFQSVAHHGSISKAADELCYVQSHVTARIKSLESNLKTELFHRHSRGTTLNSEGKKLLHYSEKILVMLDEMEKAFQDSNSPSGTLEIGTVETVINLPSILSAYCRNYPNVDLSLTTDVTKELIHQVLNRKLDGAFVAGFNQHPEIEQVEVFQEKLVLISNNEHISFEDLKRKPLLVFSKGCSYRAKLESWLYDEGVINASVLEFGTLETILGSVKSGLGISLVPQSTVHQLEQNGAIHCHKIPDKYSNISTFFIWHAESYVTSTMEKFIDTVQEFAAVDCSL
ncbi:LysR family transcriptional regulator [Lentibacillus cibarius]|uniref:LysR family transcriptional regulator n=1 Tax=Lentibacillus cibarius TaxID=2583219 RepID=A0A549YF85_9BACI|nr:LysR family transcriptional regulator [Lentibacillus cibarius]TRM10542.1 LysR family transcriptional regulator [Lentibacillus cibarius]